MTKADIQEEARLLALRVVQENLDLMRGISSREAPTLAKELNLILDHARALTTGLEHLSILSPGAELSTGIMTVVLLVRDAVQPLFLLADRLISNTEVDGNRLLKMLTHPNSATRIITQADTQCLDNLRRLLVCAHPVFKQLKDELPFASAYPGKLEQSISLVIGAVGAVSSARVGSLHNIVPPLIACLRVLDMLRAAARVSGFEWPSQNPQPDSAEGFNPVD